MSSRRNLLILALVFIGLLALTLLQNQQLALDAASPTPVPTGIYRRLFPQMAVLDIQAIRLENPATDKTFTISRASNGTWTAPDSELALDTEAATMIAQTIVLLPYESSITLTEDLDLAEYGFQSDPRLLIQVLLSNGNTHIVAVGDLTPSQAAFYALVDEQDAIYLLDGRAVSYLLTILESPPLT
jgi:hypothetical protein